MYYRLSDDCALRGWEKLPNGIVRRLRGEAIFLDSDLYAKMYPSGLLIVAGTKNYDAKAV